MSMPMMDMSNQGIMNGAPPPVSNKFPYLFPYQVNFTEEQALDWQLERFYNLCIFQKPSTSTPKPNVTTNTSNENKKQDKIKTLNQIEIGKEFFGQFINVFSSESVVDWFLRLYFRVPFYLQLHEAANVSRNFTRQGLQFQQFFFQCFLLFIKIARDDERIEWKAAKANGTQQINVCGEGPESQYNFKDHERNILLRLLIRTEFPPHTKIWSLSSASNLSVIHKNPEFPNLVKEAVQSGEIAFWALQYAVSRFGPDFEDVSILAHLLIRDRVTARMIEEFLCERSEEDKEKARQIILVAEQHWAKSVQMYRNAILTITGQQNASISSYERFKENITDLMIELRREVPRCNLIAIPWAKAAIKIYMEKHYVKNEASIEQLYDICYTVLKQRTQMRNDIVQAFRKYNDQISAEYWNNFFIDHKINQFQLAIMQPKKNAPPKMVYRPNELIDMHEIREEYLSIPEGIDVFIVDKVPKLNILEHYIRQCVNSEHPIVGLDSEWSPYVLNSRASILQIAFHSVIFILDLDSMTNKQDQIFLTQFLDGLFRNPNIMKIGFRFGEDLIQLRNKLPLCASLYEAVNLIDISRAVSRLIALSEEANFPYEDYIKFPQEEPLLAEELPNVDPNDSLMELKTEIDPVLNESKIEEVMNESVDGPICANIDVSIASVENGVENVADTTAETESAEKKKANKHEKKLKNMGLSTLCQYMLGKQLDKAEQCSVWTRRPLRKPQIRYAALDAYTIVILYNRCVEWAKQLGLNFADITDAQERISEPLPLFFDRSKLISSNVNFNQSSSN